jgi:hypothetical protein
VSVLVFFPYVAVQQALRLSANEPQVGLARDAVRTLAAGAAARSLAGTRPPVDIAVSLGPWVAVYDAAGSPLATDGRLDGNLPELPSGVFATAKRDGEFRFTWQPRSGVRSAVVLVASPNGSFVASGRSLSQVEGTIDTIGGLALLAWSGALALVAIGTFVFSPKPRGDAGHPGRSDNSLRRPGGGYSPRAFAGVNAKAKSSSMSWAACMTIGRSCARASR